MKVRLILSALALAFTASAIRAATLEWNDADMTGQFNDGLNWIGGNTPSPGDSVLFSSTGGGGTVFLDLSYTVNTISFDTNNYSFTDLNSSVLTINNGINYSSPGTTILDIPISVAATISVNATSGGTLELQGGISGTGGFQLNGGGNLLLAGTNTFTGTELITQGILTDGNANSLAPGAQLLVDTNGVVNLGFNESVTTLTDSGGGHGAVSIAGGAVLTLSGNFSDTFSGVISGAGGIDKAGSSTWTLTGANTYSGPTVIGTGSAIQIGSGGTSGSLGTTAISGGGVLAFDLSGTPAPFSNTLAGALNVVNQGSGTIQLSGNNTFTGPITVNNGKLQAGSNEAFGNAAVGNTIITVASGAILDLNGFDNSVGALSGAGSVTLGTHQLAFLNTSSVGTFSGTISGVGGSIIFAGYVEDLTGSNTYTGGTTVNAGTLLADNGSGSATGTGAITITSLGTLQIGNSSDMAGAINPTASITDNGSLVLFRGDTITIANPISGAGAVGQYGTGTAILSGNNSYSGVTTVFRGTLEAGSMSAFGGATGLSAVQMPVSPATLDLHGFNNTVGSISGVAGNSITLGSATLTLALTSAVTDFSGVISGTGGLTTYESILSLDGTNTYTGATVIGSGAILNLGNSSTTGSIANSSGVTGSGTLELNRSDSLFAFTTPISGSISVTISGGGTTVLSGTNIYSGLTTINSGVLADGVADSFSPNSEVIVNSGTQLQATTNDIVGSLRSGGSGGSVLIAGGASLASMGLNYLGDFQGVISGSGAFTVASGVQGLGGNNTYSGGTTVTGGGELFVGSSSALGTGPVTFNSGTEFSPDANVTLSNPIILANGEGLDNDDGLNFNMTLTGVISETGGAGSIVWCTPGTITLTNVNTFTGGVDMREGNLVLGNSAAAGTGTITLNNVSSLNVMTGVTVANPISIIGSTVTLAGSGTIATPIVASSAVIISPSGSPGGGPGNLTFSNGLTFATGSAIHFDIYDATGAAGTGYSLISATGGLDLTASSNTITFNIVSTSSAGVAASAINFNSGSPYSWTFASSSTAISGFSSSQFHIVESGFQNAIGAGFFSVSESGNNLELNFTPVPEPSTWCLIGAGTLALAALAYRRGRTSAV